MVSAIVSAHSLKINTKPHRVSIKSTRASSLSNLDPISQSVGKNVDSAFFCQKEKHVFYHTKGFRLQ